MIEEGKEGDKVKKMQRNNRALVPVERVASSLCPDGGLQVPLNREGSHGSANQQ